MRAPGVLGGLGGLGRLSGIERVPVERRVRIPAATRHTRVPAGTCRRPNLNPQPDLNPQSRPRMFATITANGGMTAATALITTAAPVENSRTTVQAATISARQVPIIAR